MRIIVAGSRDATEEQVLRAIRECQWMGFATAVVSGTARGADTYGEEWASRAGVAVHRFPADWKKHGKRAGPVRNRLMAQNAEGLVAVWDGTSRGTANMVREARKRGLRVLVYRSDTDAFERYPASGELADLWAEAEERAAMMEIAGQIPRGNAERSSGEMVLTP